MSDIWGEHLWHTLTSDARNEPAVPWQSLQDSSSEFDLTFGFGCNCLLLQVQALCHRLIAIYRVLVLMTPVTLCQSTETDRGKGRGAGRLQVGCRLYSRQEYTKLSRTEQNCSSGSAWQTAISCFAFVQAITNPSVGFCTQNMPQHSQSHSAILLLSLQRISSC